MSEGKRISLQVVPAERPAQAGSEARSVILSEPMRRFACNQKGCCCRGWDIPFRLEDFLRLDEHLDEAERVELRSGVKLVIEADKKGENGESILHSLKLAGVGDDGACRFLAGEGGCRVHARHGVSALPDLCVDFPAFGFRRADEAVELWFDPVCPEVLEQLDESDAPLSLHTQRGSFGDDGMDLRVAHSADPIKGRLGPDAIGLDELDSLRAKCLAACAEERPVWRTLAALSFAFRRLRPAKAQATLADFAAVEPADPMPFLQFLLQSIDAHGADLLAASLIRYRRFIYATDISPALEDRAALERNLAGWRPAADAWLAPQEDVLRPLAARYLGHRFGTPMVKGRAELRSAADEIVHVYATALRYAAALGATLQRPVDRPLFKVALGGAEFFYRSIHLPREALPWFASSGGL